MASALPLRIVLLLLVPVLFVVIGYAVFRLLNGGPPRR